jgi:hypothetical protein
MRARTAGAVVLLSTSASIATDDAIHFIRSASLAGP